MSWIQVCYQYDGSYPGFLSCVFDSYVNREEPVEFRAPEDMCCSLYPLRTVETDEAHAQRVYRSFETFGREGREMAVRCFLTCLPDREIHLYNLVQKLLREGPGFLGNLSDPVLYPVAKAVRHLEGEAHLLKGFVRFSDLGGALGGEIEPKNRVLPILRGHFCARYLNEKFFLYDRTHKEALFHVPGQSVIRPLADFQMAPPDKTEARYRLLWKRFYDTIEIKERHNPRRRMSHMPKRYWETMTEFQGEDYYRPAAPEVPEPAPLPGGGAGEEP